MNLSSETIVASQNGSASPATHSSINGLRVKIFADGADRDAMLEMYEKPWIAGFTTNPTLMRKSGINDYRTFAVDILRRIPDRSISLEVFADDFEEMHRQARAIASWGGNVLVKIPITNTRGESSAPLLARLAREKIPVNVTALLSLDQVRDASQCLADGPPSKISVFAGRIADTGRDPMPLMAAAVELLHPYPNLELIWASPREVLNVFQADAVGCHVITATPEILRKLELAGRDLHEYSLDTVRMFHQDACKAGYHL
jgi:transaldolase